MIFYTLFYAYPRSDKINVVLTSVIIYLVCYGLIIPSATPSIPFADLLGDTMPLLISALIFMCDLYLMTNHKITQTKNQNKPKNQTKNKRKKHRKVHFNTRKNKYHQYPGYKTPQHANPYQQRQMQPQMHQQQPTQEQMMQQYQMLAQQYNPNQNHMQGQSMQGGGMGNMNMQGGGMGNMQYDPNIRGPPEQIKTRNTGMFNYNNETESEGDSVLVSDTSSEISFSEEEY